MKKTLSLLLVLAMVLSSFTAFAGADTVAEEVQTHKAYIAGISDDTFAPKNNVTRQQIARMIAVANGLEKGTPEFKDANEIGNWAKDSVGALQKAGIVVGDEKGNFNPKDEVKRSELAIMLVKAYENIHGDIEVKDISFKDVADDAWYAEAVKKAATVEIVAGIGNGKFDPNGNATREQAVAMVNRMLGLDKDNVENIDKLETKFKDVKEWSDWAKEDILLASTDFNYVEKDGKIVIVDKEEEEELEVVEISAIDANTIEVTLSDETVHEVTLEEALEPNVETEVTFTIDDVEYTEIVTFVVEPREIESVEATDANTLLVVFADVEEAVVIELADALEPNLETEVTFEYENNEYTATVTYEVDDVMAPVITVTGVKSPVAFGDEVEMPTVTVFDEVNENLEATLVITIKDGEDDVVVDAIDSRVPGTYTLTYTAEDYAGNKATATATVTVEGPEALTSVDPVTTSSSKVVVTADEKDLTADNFIVTFLDDEAEAGSDPVELTIVSVTNIEDAEGNPTTDYVIEYEDLNGKSGKLTVNEYTPVEVNYTDAGLTAAVEAVNTAAGTTVDITKADVTYKALEAAVLNYADILDDELKEEYQAEIATSQTQNYTRLTEAIERVNAKAAEDKAKEDAETLKTVNELTSANSAEQVRTALTNAGATLLADANISGADYFDAIEGTTFESLDEVVAAIDAFNLATVEEAVAAAEAAVEGINFDTAEATTAKEKADGLVDAYAAETAYNLPTTKEAVEADEDADTTAYDFKVRLAEVQDAINLEKARQDVLDDEKIESVKANLETLAGIENSGLDADTIKDDVANDYNQTIGYEAQYKIEIGRLADTATVAHIQNAVNLANERAEAAAEQAAVDAVFAAESIVVTEAEGDNPRTVTAGDQLITNLTALEAAEKVEDSKVVENNKNAYAVALDKLDAKTATRADILALVDTVNAQEAADDVAAVFTTFTVAPNADDVLEATFYADTTVETPETDDGVAFKAALDVLVTAEGYTADRIADYALEINKLDPATATKADIEAAIETVDAQAEAQALVDAVNKATTKEDMDNALVAVDYAPYINLGSIRRLEVADLLLGNNEAADTEVKYETVAEIEIALDEVIAEYNTLIANVNSATTITEARAALQAIVDSNATVTNLVDPVTNAQAEKLLATFDGETPAVYTTISGIDGAITP